MGLQKKQSKNKVQIQPLISKGLQLKNQRSRMINDQNTSKCFLIWGKSVPMKAGEKDQDREKQAKGQVYKVALQRK